MPPADVEALYPVVAGRRDIRNGFLPDPIADDLLTRVLTAAHQAPSVGLSQPWDFIVLRDRAAREQAHALARRQREVFAAGLPGPFFNHVIGLSAGLAEPAESLAATLSSLASWYSAHGLPLRAGSAEPPEPR